MYNSSLAADLVELLRFVAGDADPAVLLSARGATVTRAGAGLYDVTLAETNQIDPADRTITPTVGGAAPSLAITDVTSMQTDRVFRIQTFTVAGQPSDTGAEITVLVCRAVNH